MQQLIRDGVKLCYEEAGSGPPPLLFVHGWCCDHSFFAPQFEHFQAGHRVVSVDLRGHGESDKPEQPYTMEGYADDLAWLSGELGLERLVVIGHSMGGVIAMALAANYPELVRAAVMIDAPILISPAAIEARRPQREALKGLGYREVAAGLVDGMFLPTDDATRKASIAAGMLAVPQHVMASCQEHLPLFDMARAARTAKQPLLYIGAAEPRGDAPLLRELAPQLVTGQTVGAGHFNQLEVPDQVNAMVERFFVTSAAASI